MVRASNICCYARSGCSKIFAFKNNECEINVYSGKKSQFIANFKREAILAMDSAGLIQGKLPEKSKRFSDVFNLC